MTEDIFTFYFERQSMSWNELHKSDCLAAGLLECAYETSDTRVFVWHSVKLHDAARVLHYIQLEFDPEYIELCEEDFNGVMCHDKLICAFGR